MRIWIVKTGEPLPTDPGNARLLRAGLMAQELVALGHEVVWWTSSFNHQRKKQRSVKSIRADICHGYSLRLIRSPGYKKNVSLERLWDHWITAKRFERLAKNEPPPDVLICALPTLELGAAATRIAKRMSTPLVVDIRDMWPDVFEQALPLGLRRLASLVIRRYRRTAQAICRSAAALTGPSKEFVQWGVQMAQRAPAAHDKNFPFAYRPGDFSSDQLLEAKRFWSRFGIQPNQGGAVLAFVGSIGRQFDFGPIVRAAHQIDQAVDLRVVLCGDGEGLPALKEAARGCDRIVLPGWINAAQIQTLLSISCAGLAPYVQTDNFRNNLPNKVIEYLASGLPVATSLDGSAMHRLLDRNDCGASYGHDAGRLKRIVEEWLSLDSTRRRQADNARTLFQERFNATEVYREMANYLAAVVDQGCQPMARAA